MQASQTKLTTILPGNKLTTIIKNKAMHALQTKIKQLQQLSNKQYIPQSMHYKQKFKNSIHRNHLIKKQHKDSALQAFQTNLKQIHPDNQ